MNKKEHIDRLAEEAAASVGSWADFYEAVQSYVTYVFATRGEADVFLAILAAFSFFEAMRESPDEGDIRKLITAATEKIFNGESLRRIGNPGFVIQIRDDAFADPPDESAADRQFDPGFQKFINSLITK